MSFEIEKLYKVQKTDIENAWLSCNLENAGGTQRSCMGSHNSK